MLSSTIIPIPAGDKDFEEKCVVLFASLLNDPNVKTVGTRGQGQQGLDLIGTRDRDPDQPVGVQCKLKTKGGRLTEDEVRNEVAQALTVQPPLTEYYIVTTASDDTALGHLAMALRQEQARLARKIDIQVWGWDFLQQKIRGDLKALAAFDPGQSPAQEKLLELAATTLVVATEGHAETQGLLKENQVLLQTIVARGGDAGHGDALEQHLDQQVDDYRDLINEGRPKTALAMLIRLEAKLPPQASSAIRARIRGNQGWAHIRLGDDALGGRMLIEAAELNPSNPRHTANRVLGLALTGEAEAAYDLARDTLQRDPTADLVAVFAFHVATLAPELGDPHDIIPAELLDLPNVRFQRVHYQRARDDEHWRALAAEALAAEPDDDNAMRIAGEALLDRGLAVRKFTRLLPMDGETDLRRAAELLCGAWSRTSGYENRDQPPIISIGVNLTTAYRALGDLDAAQKTVQELLAIASTDTDVIASAAFLAIDREDIPAALRFTEALPESPTKTVQSMLLLQRDKDPNVVLDFATAERRAALDTEEQTVFDVIVCRAECALPSTDTAALVTRLILAHPRSIGAHALAADTFREHDIERAKVSLSDGLRLLNETTTFAERWMLASVARAMGQFDGVIRCLDGFVPTDEASSPLLTLALAFANCGVRPRTHPFFKSLAPEVISDPQFARLAGAAEAMRGDLTTAERHLRMATEGAPNDLRSHLQLISVLSRQDRLEDAQAHTREIDEAIQASDPMDQMRLAHHLARAGEALRALRLGYRTVRDNADNASVLASYPALIFGAQSLPVEATRTSPAGEDIWFKLVDGEETLQGVIEQSGSLSQDSYPLDHPLSIALTGKVVGDEVMLSRGIGPDRVYQLAELKPKYVWLLHHIMETYGSRFPTSNALLSVRIEGGDVQPILDTVKQLSESERRVAQVYGEQSVPLAAMAAIARRSVIELAEYLAQVHGQVRACVGNERERKRAFAQLRAAKGKGAVLDTLTLWTADRLGVLPALKAYFGRLVVARSTVDALMQLREERRTHLDHEYMTIGFRGDQAVRDVRSPKDTARVVDRFDALIKYVSTASEVLPVDGSDDLRLDDDPDDRFSFGESLDPIHLARTHGLFLLSDDLHLRQLANQCGARRGAWLQVVVRHLADQGQIEETDYLLAIGYLAAMRHDHIWLDANTLIAIRQMDDARREGIFAAVIEYIGGRRADIGAHARVVFEVLRAAVAGKFGTIGPDASCSALLTRLISERDDWREVLEVLRDWGRIVGDQRSRLASDYVAGWISGHFLDVGTA
jgi:tetratricopeptide (TPR) repeat protein